MGATHEIAALDVAALVSNGDDMFASFITGSAQPKLTALVAAGKLDDTIASALVETGKQAHVYESAGKVALGVAVYGLTASGTMTGDEVASKIGLDKGRVSHLAFLGRVVATVGIPAGLTGPELDRALSQGARGDVQEILKSGRPSAAKIGKAVKAKLAEIKAKRTEAAPSKRGARNLGGTPKDPTATPSITEGQPDDETPDATARHFAALVDAVAWLSEHTDKLSAADRKTVRATCGVMVAALDADADARSNRNGRTGSTES